MANEKGRFLWCWPCATDSNNLVAVSFFAWRSEADRIANRSPAYLGVAEFLSYLLLAEVAMLGIWVVFIIAKMVSSK